MWFFQYADYPSPTNKLRDNLCFLVSIEVPWSREGLVWSLSSIRTILPLFYFWWAVAAFLAYYCAAACESSHGPPLHAWKCRWAEGTSLIQREVLVPPRAPSHGFKTVVLFEMEKISQWLWYFKGFLFLGPCGSPHFLWRHFALCL